MWDLWPRISLKEITDDGDGAKHFLFLNRHDKSDDYIRISLLDGLNSYHTEITADYFKNIAEKSRLSLTEFTDLTISALTCEKLTPNTFTYTVIKSDDKVQLTWKKVVPDESVKIRLGSLDFRTVNSSNEVCNTLQQLSKYITQKSQEIKALQNEKSDLQETNKQLQNILEMEIVKKDHLERELYTKFVIVLNRKKDKCNQYKAELSKPRTQIPETAEVSDDSIAETSKSSSRKRDTSLFFDDSSDDSQPVTTQRVVKQKRSKATAPIKEQEKSKPKKSLRSSSPVYEADTQELIDIL